MSTLEKMTEPQFIDKLTQIDQALTKGNLITTDLKIVEKHGIKWVWIKLTRFLMQIFCHCTNLDPWKAYRIHLLADSLSIFTKNNQDYLPSAKTHLKSIITKLKDKANHSPRKIQLYLHAINAFEDGFKNSNLDKHVPINLGVQPIQNPAAAKELLPVKNGVAMQSKDKVCHAITTFANDLCYRISINEPQGSFAVSPISIIASLGMCLHLIKADKKEQFLEKLGLQGLNEMEAHQGIAAALKETVLPQNFINGTINITQGLAYKKDMIVQDTLLDIVKNIYNADIITTDDLMKDVNQWVFNKTQEKIPTILANNDATMVLLNAIYLNLQWAQKFEKPISGWQVEDFTCADGTTTPVSMMKQKGNFLLYEGDSFAMLEKTYLSPFGRKLTQLIFLPNSPQDLVELEKTLTFDTIQKCRKEGNIIHNMDLMMPKTKVENEFHLFGLLKQMEIPLDAIDENNAEITDIIHKTFVSTNEEGTEAAAVTAIMMNESATLNDPKAFEIKHSYAYLIMDGDTMLFRGRVNDKAPLVVDTK